jgi:hypothetical protein
VAKVYSERFVEVGGVGVTKSYVVPNGKRAVVRGLAYGCYLSTGSLVWLGVNGMWPYLVRIPGDTGGGFQDMRAVAYAGELITIASSGSQVWAHCAGYLFDDTEPRVSNPIIEGEVSPVPPGWVSVSSV